MDQYATQSYSLSAEQIRFIREKAAKATLQDGERGVSASEILREILDAAMKKEKDKAQAQAGK